MTAGGRPPGTRARGVIAWSDRAAGGWPDDLNG